MCITNCHFCVVFASLSFPLWFKIKTPPIHELRSCYVIMGCNEWRAEKWDRPYFTAVATGGHSRLISHPAALLRWKQLGRRTDLHISVFLPLSLSLSPYLKPLLKSLHSDVFVINYTIWDRYSQTYTHAVVFFTAAEVFIICGTCCSHFPQACWARLLRSL